MTSSVQRKTVQELNTIIFKYLQHKHHDQSEPQIWEIRESKTSGFGVFIKRDVDVGEVIFKDYPIIIGPRGVPECPKVCVNCLKNGNNLTACNKGCGLPICSTPKCQEENSYHQKECKFIREYTQGNSSMGNINDLLFDNFTPIRSLFLNQIDKEVLSCLIAHRKNIRGHEIETLKTKCRLQFKEDDENFLKFISCILDANAFEITSENCDNDNHYNLRGIYSLASLINHSCIPNVVHVFNEHHHMIGKASRFIPKNSELFHSYTSIMWGTLIRQYVLQTTKHFICRCDRCIDPTEFGTYMGSILCRLCKGLMCPLNPLNMIKSKWQCRDCGMVINGSDVGQSMAVFGSILRNVKSNDFPFMQRFLEDNLKPFVPETNQVVLELKLKIVLCLGHQESFKWEELSCDLLKLKKVYCEDLINVMEQLRCGQNKIRGILLYELLCCNRHLLKHGIKSAIDNIDEYIDEILSIMEYDATAPIEIKEILNKKK